MSAEHYGQPVDLRAHHLYSLQQQYSFPISTKALKAIKLAVLGYQDPEFPEHLMNVVDDIINGTTQKVRIVDHHDAICEKCSQKREHHCRVAGRNYSSAFLSLLDQAIAENSELEIGATYTSKEIVGRIKSVRKGLIRTAIQIPALLEIARLMEISKK